MVLVSRSANKAVSEMLGIDDKYLAYCIDEAACYLAAMLNKPPEENSGNKLLKKLAGIIPKKRK